VHEKQKHYKCQICGKTSFYKHNHYKHIKEVHEKQKDHQCDLCHKSFSRKTDLKKHSYVCKKVKNTKKQRKTPKLPKPNDNGENENETLLLTENANSPCEIENSKMETENEIYH
jgi:hypothetical protein